MKHLRFVMFITLKSDIIIEPLFWHAMKNSFLALFLAAPLFAQFDTAEVLGTGDFHALQRTIPADDLSTNDPLL